MFNLQTVKSLIFDEAPKEIHVNIRRISKEDLPCDEKGFEEWLQERWRLKEENLRKFYKTKRFDESQSWPPPSLWPLAIAFVFWFSMSCK